MSTTVVRRNPTRERKEPERFKDMEFVKGSGFAGCDHYDRGYDRGHCWRDYRGTYRDTIEARNDSQYSKVLQNKLNVEEATQKLPSDIANEIKKLVLKPSLFKNDAEFIAPDNVEPEKENEIDEEIPEWESGEDTDSEEEMFDFELEED